MKKALVLLLVAMIFILSGCYNAGDFYALRQLERVEITGTGTTSVGKTSYTTITFKNENNKEETLRVYEHDYGFEDYFNSAKLFDEKVIVDLVINEDSHITSIVLVDRGGNSDGKE